MMTLLKNSLKCKLIVIGDVILDVYLMGEVQRISPEGPVPVVWVRQKTTTLGGAGNVALNLVGLGCNVHLVGVRGNDTSGRLISAIIQKNHVIDDLAIDDNHPTTTKTRIISQSQQLIRLDEEEIWECGGQFRNHLLDKIEKAIEKTNAVILSDYNKGVLNGDLPNVVIQMCKMKNVPVFIDPKRKAWERYQSATCVTPNVSEIEEITGTAIGRDEKKLVEQVRYLRKRYNFEWLLATRGPEGMCLVGPDDFPLFIKSIAREVFDVSGAGDTVIASIAAAVSCGIPFPKAAEISNVAAGIVVGKLGSQPINIRELEAEWRIKESGFLGINRTKISTLEAAQIRVKSWQAMNEKVVMTHGCYDLIHPHDIHNFNYAKELGDRLIVGLYADESIRRLKGENGPIFKLTDRSDVLSALRCVDLVVLLDGDNPQLLINTLKPNIFVKGADVLLDNLIDNEFIQSHGCHVEMLPNLNNLSDDV